MNATRADYLTYHWTGFEATGVYHVLVGWTVPNSLQDGSIDAGDMVALDWKALQFVPQVASR